MLDFFSSHRGGVSSVSILFSPQGILFQFENWIAREAKYLKRRICRGRRTVQGASRESRTCPDLTNNGQLKPVSIYARDSSIDRHQPLFNYFSSETAAVIFHSNFFNGRISQPRNFFSQASLTNILATYAPENSVFSWLILLSKKSNGISVNWTYEGITYIIE